MIGHRTVRQCATAILMVSWCLAALVGCQSQPEPIRIGFLGEISGRSSQLGLAGRNGAQLAVEEFNASGGIDGRPVELVVADVSSSAEATSAIQYLADSGAVAIIGPMTSASAVRAVPAADRIGITLIGPTVSTDILTGKDDSFLRIYPSNDNAAQTMAEAVSRRLDSPRVAVVLDQSNAAHTETWYKNFTSGVESLGGSVVAVETFVSGQGTDFTKIVERALDSSPNCVLILANSTDGAMVSQRLRLAGGDAQIIMSEWSVTADLIALGGSSVEGLLYLDTFDRVSRSPEFTGFVREFEDRFGEPIGFGTIHAYEAAQVVLEALAAGATRDSIRDYIIERSVFEGLQGTISFDEFGDASREQYLSTVRNGRLVPVSAE